MSDDVGMGGCDRDFVRDVRGIGVVGHILGHEV
jgi:hypothetical protein